MFGCDWMCYKFLNNRQYRGILPSVQKCYKRISYDLNVMRQSACSVIYQITVDNFAVLFNCTPVDQASDSIMAST